MFSVVGSGSTILVGCRDVFRGRAPKIEKKRIKEGDNRKKEEKM